MKNKIIKIEEVLGKTYNYLTVLREGEPYLAKANYLSRRWIFKCICGVEKSISPNNVFSGSVKSCGCMKSSIRNEKIQIYYNNKFKTPVEDKLYGSYSQDAKRSNREFKLTKQEFYTLVNSNCYYCNIAPYLSRKNKTGSVIKLLNGVDRINSSKGYTLDNVVPCCPHCNRAKMDRNVDDFINWVKLIYKNLQTREIWQA